jgi:hypothetical protein
MNTFIKPLKSIVMVLFVTSVFAQKNDTKHEWLIESPYREPQVRFSNLKDNETVSSPFIVKFGMSHWGIAPAEQKQEKTGHHHLLIDTPLPLNIDKPIPFSDKYLHFGKGQMETVLNLPVGKHTLRLLLADYKHIPTYLYSNELTINVVLKENNPSYVEISPENKPKVEILYPLKDSKIFEESKIVFHTSNLNVSHSDSKLENTGTFRLLIKHSKKSNIETINFPAGQTECWLKLPKGAVSFKLEYVKNSSKEIHSVKSEWTNVTVI